MKNTQNVVREISNYTFQPFYNGMNFCLLRSWTFWDYSIL